jgi:NDP-sugar pyrophosphorylase family protein
MDIGNIDVAVLAGGLGTRLRGVLPDSPKSLAPVDGKPFLEHLLLWLARQGVRRVLLGLGYRASDVVAFLERRPFPSLEIETVVEPEPLGTAGAVAFAAPHFRSSPILVMNGDTIVDADLNEFLRAHCGSSAPASILCVEVDNAGRYGRVEIGPDNRLVRFAEKDPAAAGGAWINAGMYLFERPFLERFAGIGKGSLERDVLERAPSGHIFAFQTKGRFLDIGTPETLALAPEVLTPL